MDKDQRGQLERVTRQAAKDGLLPGITEVVQGVLAQPGPYGDTTRQNMRDALVLFNKYMGR